MDTGSFTDAWVSAKKMKRRKNHEKSCISTFDSRNNLSDGYAFCRIDAGWILRRMKRRKNYESSECGNSKMVGRLYGRIRSNGSKIWMRFALDETCKWTESTYTTSASAVVWNEQRKPPKSGGRIMTNREKLAQMSNQELADWLCGQNTTCDTCRKRKMCNWFRQDGFLRWLESEAEEES